MLAIKDLIETALESADREDMYRAFMAILTCTDPVELEAALTIADGAFVHAINARLDQMALEEYLSNVLPALQQQVQAAADLNAAREERLPKPARGIAFGRI